MVQVDIIRRHITRYLAWSLRVYVSCLDREIDVLALLCNPTVVALMVDDVMKRLGYEPPKEASHHESETLRTALTLVSTPPVDKPEPKKRRKKRRKAKKVKLPEPTPSEVPA